MVLAWKDKRIVKAISTKHDSSVVSISRRKKGGHGAMEEVQKPVCICDYNQHMSGVDHVDQMISYYPCTRKTLKWTKKVFFYFMELSVTNAHVLYAARCGRSRRPMTLHEFHVKLVSKMCRKRLEHNNSSSSEEEDAPPPKAPTYDPPNRLRGGFKSHHISTLPPTANKKYPQRVCRLCSKNGIRRDTRFYCKDCKVALCNRPCFGDYHSKKHL